MTQSAYLLIASTAVDVHRLPFFVFSYFTETLIKMRIIVYTLLSLCLIRSVQGDDTSDSLDQNAGYTLGWQFMHNLKEDDLQLDKEAFLKGLEDATNNNPPSLNEKAMRTALDYLQARRQLNRQTKTEKLIQEGQAYLENNAHNQGVITLASGLQYKVLQQGEGSTNPTESDGVGLRFIIRDLQNQEIGRNLNDLPQKTALKALMPGWQEALKLMKTGDRWEIILSPNLAYGTNGSPNRVVKPSQSIITELELVEIIPAETLKSEQEKARKAQKNQATVVPESQFSFSK